MEDYLNLPFEEVLKSQTADYKCLQRLGWGGSAETYLMLSTAGLLRGQLFAVKVFRRLSRPEWQANFLDEIKFLQSCNHPAVMRVFDNLITPMLEPDPANRPSAVQMVDPWQGLFLEAAKRSHALEGRVV